MVADILGDLHPPEPSPPNNGVCPDCGGEIKSDLLAGWRCYDCDKEFEEDT